MESIAPEVVELSGGQARLGPGRSAGWLTGWLIVISAAVGLAVSGSPSSDPVAPPIVAATDGADEAAVLRSSVPPPSEGRVDERSWVSLVMPGRGDVIVATAVAVAGQVTGIGPEHGWPESVAVTIEILSAGETIGWAELPVVAGQFSGWVDVVGPVAARSVELVISDPQRPGRIALHRLITLQAPDH